MTSITENRSFSPITISGCQIWLDAADSSTFTMNGSNISSWRDKTGNGFNVTQASAGSQPTRDANSVVFNYTSLEYSGSVGIHQNSYTAYMIYKCQIVEQGINLLDCRDSTTGYMFVNIQFFSWTATAAAYSRAWTPSQNITMLGFNNTPAFIYNKSVNGSSFSPGGDGWSPNAAAYYFRLGGFPGNIYECLLYTRSVTSTEHNQITGYLAWKWGIQSLLPGAHPNYLVTGNPSPPFPSFALATTAFKVKSNPAFFTPTSVAGCTLWLDGADPSATGIAPANGATVSTWVDKSTNGLTVSAASSQPTYLTNAANGLGTVAFNGSQGLSAGTVTGTKLIGNTNSCAIYAVVRFENTSGRSIPYSWDDQTYEARFLLQYAEGNNIALLKRGGTNTTIPLINTLYYIVSYWQNELNTQLNVNGTTIASLSNFSNNDISSFSRVFNVGYYANDPAGWNMRGNIAEILFFNTHIPTNFQQIEGYLAWKWGIQTYLPGVHPNYSSNGYTISPFPSFAIATTPFKLQRAPFVDPTIKYSALFSSANNPSLTIPASSSLTLGTNDHTIEFWMYQTSRGQYDTAFIYGNTVSFATNNYYFSVGNYLGFVIGNGAGNWAINLNGGTATDLNVWNHYAVVRNGTTFTVYINGISRGSQTSSINIAAQGDVFRIGDYNSSGTFPINGYITNFRVVNGTAVYTSNFTPPTSPLTAIPNTQILLQGLTDRSPNAFTVTNNGGVTLSTTVSPFA